MQVNSNSNCNLLPNSVYCSPSKSRADLGHFVGLHIGLPAVELCSPVSGKEVRYANKYLFSNSSAVLSNNIHCMQSRADLGHPVGLRI